MIARAAAVAELADALDLGSSGATRGGSSPLSRISRRPLFRPDTCERYNGQIMAPSRTRRIAKWTGLTICMLITLAWVATLRYALSTNFIRVSKRSVATLDLTRGSLVLFQSPAQAWHDRPGSGWLVEPRNYRTRQWWPHYRSFQPIPASWMLWIPLWLPFLAIAIPTAWLWRRDRRHPPGYCRKCGYDLTGNVTGVCSECATEIEGAKAST